jgi:DNA-binding Lrp family transcriptional regulator
MAVTETEQAILRIAQRDLPDSLTPYADIAREAGTDEAAVLALLARLRESGAIRRFGASLRHQKTGYTHNAMVAWEVAPGHIDQAGEKAAQNRSVSHCYHRPACEPDWPYTLYTMVHGRSEDECRAVIEELSSIPQMTGYAVLNSLKELKKTSMIYFGREHAEPFP